MPPAGVKVQVVAPEPLRGTSTAIQGLSRNWPEVPVSMSFVSTYAIGSCSARVGGVAVFLVVQVEVPGEEDRADVRAPVEGHAAVVDESVGARPDSRVGRRTVSLQGRGHADSGLILGIAREESALPALSAVEGLEDAEPGVPRKRARDAPGLGGEVHGPVVVRSGDEVEQVPRGDGQRRLVLPLEERVASRPLRARDHVDVLSRHLRPEGRGDEKHADGRGSTNGLRREPRIRDSFWGSCLGLNSVRKIVAGRRVCQ